MSPLKNANSLKQIWSLFTLEYFVASTTEIGPAVLEKKLTMHLHYVTIISLWQKGGSFIQTDFNRLYLGMLNAEYGWNWHSDSGELNLWKDMDIQGN